jgi:DNA-binding MarR family transcriptional regulator
MTPDEPGACVGAGVRDDLGWLLGVMFRAYVRATGDALGDLPGGARGYQVLRTVVQDKPGTQLAMAQRLGVDRTVMTYLLDDLEKAGLVARRPDPQDRRARLVQCTVEGRRRLAELEKKLARVESHVLAGLDAQSAITFRVLLGRAAESLEHPGDRENPCQVMDDIAAS